MKRATRIGLVGAGVLLVVGAMVLVGAWLIPAGTHTAAEFGIETYVSQHDEDGDGVDDQTDILTSAKAYVATRPRYESAYYEEGRPDDGRGVCTDVVDQALTGAGYDLQTLVDTDVREHPDAYDIATPDRNIDFRRVRNLRIWFDRHAQSISLDPHDLAEWQGGDIVCWNEHIGVVSDNRNDQGETLVIHHWGPWQVSYEEDVFRSPLSTSLGPIVGHWRMR